MKQDTIELGSGSGGRGSTADTAQSTDGTYSLSANRIELISRRPLPPGPPGSNGITILAAGNEVIDGKVDIGAGKGVRIAVGPPRLPATSSDDTDGAEIVVGETKSITLQRGLISNVDQKITMSPGSITVDGGTGMVTIQSATEIKLCVAGGTSSITLTPAMIIISGPIVKIN
jgi:hypothetical protein